MLQGDVAALKLALVLLFCLPGVPCVYYGTEAGLSGGAEPSCREAMPWGDPQQWSHDLRLFIASLAALRQDQPALRGTDLEIALLPGSEGDQGLRLLRRDSACGAVVELVVNRSRTSPLPLACSTGAVLWPPALAGGALPAVLEPQTALVLMSTAPHR
jgi:neopullulanase